MWADDISGFLGVIGIKGLNLYDLPSLLKVRKNKGQEKEEEME